MFQPEKIDFTKTKTFSARDRHNLVRIDNMAVPGQEKGPLFTSPEFDVLVEKLKKARDEKRTITCFIGAHVIKCGLSRYLIWLMENGYITHLASNGAGSIHDFELAYLGGTSEHVPTAIEDGSFGMWEETGRWMNEAIREGDAQDVYKRQVFGQSVDRVQRIMNDALTERINFTCNDVERRFLREGIQLFIDERLCIVDGGHRRLKGKQLAGDIVEARSQIRAAGEPLLCAGKAICPGCRAAEGAAPLHVHIAHLVNHMLRRFELNIL